MSEESAKTERFLLHLKPLQGSLEAYARRNLLDSGDAEDVLQTVVANTYRDFHRYVEGTSFRAWIFRYLNLEILARNRQHEKSKHAPLPNDPPAVESWQKAVDERWFDQLAQCPDSVLETCDEVLAAAVRDLPPMERSTLLLRSIGEFKYREISEILDIPVGTVMSHLSRSRARLRQRLMQHCRQQGLLKED